MTAPFIAAVIKRSLLSLLYNRFELLVLHDVFAASLRWFLLWFTFYIESYRISQAFEIPEGCFFSIVEMCLWLIMVVHNRPASAGHGGPDWWHPLWIWFVKKGMINGEQLLQENATLKWTQLMLKAIHKINLRLEID